MKPIMKSIEIHIIRQVVKLRRKSFSLIHLVVKYRKQRRPCRVDGEFFAVVSAATRLICLNNFAELLVFIEPPFSSTRAVKK